jgi:hypothetical protein
MAGIDLVAAEARLAEYLTAEQKVLSGQEYEVDGKRMKRADLDAIRKGIAYWNGWVQRLARGGIRVRGAIPD